MPETIPPIPPPFGASYGNPGSLNVNRVDTMPVTTDPTNTTNITNVSQSVIDENLPQLLDSIGGYHVTNVLAFDKEDFISWKVRPASHLRVGSCTKQSDWMTSCTSKGIQLALPWGRTARLDSGMRAGRIGSVFTSPLTIHRDECYSHGSKSRASGFGYDEPFTVAGWSGSVFTSPLTIHRGECYSHGSKSRTSGFGYSEPFIVGFWWEVSEYIESKTKQYGRRTYAGVLGKGKMIRQSVIRFSGIYSNVMRMAQESGAGAEDYVQKEMIHYEVETGIPFKLRHCWEVLRDRPKWKEIELPRFSTGSGGSKRHKSSSFSSFNTESGEASINLNTNVGDNNEDEVQKIRRPEGRDKARATWKKNKESKLTGSSTLNEDEMARVDGNWDDNSGEEEHLEFLEIKMRDVECREQEIEQQDMRFYLHPYDHLTGTSKTQWRK
nr:hypothetical protein [Tanacetum cinerariifolium]